MIDLPEQIQTLEQLEEVLSTPSAQLCESISELASPLVIVGAGGKMGPSLARLAQRAAELAGHRLEIIAASRFRNAASRDELETQGIKTAVVDVLDPRQVADLPDSQNVIYLVGMKFGTSTDPAYTWATNTIAPINIATRYHSTKLVALSTGNVYPFSRVESRGSIESDSLTPQGEYANAAVARERLFEYFCHQNQSPTTLVRLNYAHDLRYGVLTDIANKIYAGQELGIEMGYFNAIWQGDANEMILRGFELCDVPARAVNVTSTKIYRVKDVALEFGRLFGCETRLRGEEATTALLSNCDLMLKQWGEPRVGLDRMMRWITGWTLAGGKTLGKPTHFEVRDGKY